MVDDFHQNFSCQIFFPLAMATKIIAAWSTVNGNQMKWVAAVSIMPSWVFDLTPVTENFHSFEIVNKNNIEIGTSV